MFKLLYKYWRDLLIASILGIIFSCATYQGAQLIPTIFITDWKKVDVWFQGDLPRNFEVITKQNSSHHEAIKKHPLFSLIAYPPVTAIKKILKLSNLSAVYLFISLTAFLWVFILFLLIRMLGCRKLDSILLTLLGTVSATSMFWSKVPETFPLGSVTFLLTLCFAIFSQQANLSSFWYFIINVLTISMSTTNWMAGIILTFINKSFQYTIKIMAYTFAFVSLLWGIQKYIFPFAQYYLDVLGNTRYLFRSDSGGPLYILGSFFYHTLIMPAFQSIQIFDNDHMPEWPIMLTQLSNPGSGSIYGIGAVTLWTLLLILGIWAIFSIKEHYKFRLILGLIILSQLGFHLYYGEETFLYSMHFIVLLIPLVALGFLTKFRPLALGLLLLLLPFTTLNNINQFNKALTHLKTYGTARDQVNIQKYFRPNDPWPRNAGHVILAYPGSAEINKAYHEPGGSFSPSVGSFGISIWVLNKEGELLKTSDTISLNEIQQEFIKSENKPVPGILSETPYYTASWSPLQPGHWILNIKAKDSKNNPLILVLRSVGPAGGPVRSINVINNKLSINERWKISVTPPIQNIYLGEENNSKWINANIASSILKSSRGWGYAKISLNEGSILIEDTSFKDDDILKYTSEQSTLQVNLPDKEFIKCLHSQISHILMGIVGIETRPGDPLAYPLPWQRTEAYIVFSLAKSGPIDILKQLASHLAENDFFGGFGPEADAPGLGIWALKEASERLQDREFDISIWPHIERKARIIENMISSKNSIHQSFKGTVLPMMERTPYIELSLISKTTKNGLAEGKVDQRFPILYVNAINYLGLINASSLANRLGHIDLATKWKIKAMKLKESWNNAFEEIIKEDEIEPRSYIAALWPSTIANLHPFKETLTKRWQKRQDENGNFRNEVLWTYFAAAEAHQWLFLNHPERAWKTLQWFFKNQVSPGLYSWWESAPEENTFQKWEKIRGWTKPSSVTPHYRTSAEILLLQLDFLAHLDINTSDTIIIAEGIPQEWLKSPMHVKNLYLSGRSIDWEWDGKQMNVTIHGANAKIRLGSVFPKDTIINIKESSIK